MCCGDPCRRGDPVSGGGSSSLGSLSLGPRVAPREGLGTPCMVWVLPDPVWPYIRSVAGGGGAKGARGGRSERQTQIEKPDGSRRLPLWRTGTWTQHAVYRSVRSEMDTGTRTHAARTRQRSDGTHRHSDFILTHARGNALLRPPVPPDGRTGAALEDGGDEGADGLEVHRLVVAGGPRHPGGEGGEGGVDRKDKPCPRRGCQQCKETHPPPPTAPGSAPSTHASQTRVQKPQQRTKLNS